MEASCPGRQGCRQRSHSCSRGGGGRPIAARGPVRLRSVRLAARHGQGQGQGAALPPRRRCADRAVRRARGTEAAAPPGREGGGGWRLRGSGVASRLQYAQLCPSSLLTTEASTGRRGAFIHAPLASSSSDAYKLQLLRSIQIKRRTLTLTVPNHRPSSQHYVRVEHTLRSAWGPACACTLAHCIYVLYIYYGK